MTTVESSRWDTDRGLRIAAWTAACVAGSSQFMYVADSAIVALSLPELERSFTGSSRGMIAWVQIAFLVAQSSMVLVGGRLGDRYGRKRYFLIGMGLFTLGALLTAMAPTVGLLVAARTVQGVGAGILTPGALALVYPMFPAGKVALAIGLWGTIGSVASWLTPTAGALLITHSWRWGFAALVPVGLIALLLGRRWLVEQSFDGRSGRTDRIGYLLGPPAFGLLMLVISRGETWGWTSASTLLIGGTGLVLLVAFVRRSMVADVPLLDLDIVRNRWFRANASIGILQQMGYYAWYLTCPIVMRVLWHWTVPQIGFALAIGQVVSSFSSPLGGHLVVRYGFDLPIALGTLANAMGALWLAVTARAVPDFWGSFTPMALLFGFGNGMAGTVVTGAALAALPAGALGAGNSVQQLARRMGGAVGVAAGAALIGEGSGAALLEGGKRVWLFVAMANVAILVPLLRARHAERSVHPVAAMH